MIRNTVMSRGWTAAAAAAILATVAALAFLSIASAQSVSNLTVGSATVEPGGTVTIRAWCPRESGHVLQIVDTGIGIAPKDIPMALAQFGQVDSDLNRKHDGTGLGLPLTKALVELHGGSLDLQSEVGTGTTVTLRFPAWRIVSEIAVVA